MRMVRKVSVPRLYAGTSLIWRLAGCMPTWGPGYPGQQRVLSMTTEQVPD